MQFANCPMGFARRLLAHTYVLLLVLLTSGGRIGAAAAEKLNLFARGALNTYRLRREACRSIAMSLPSAAGA